ncbi:hypothetical protein CASFOL_028415 [Castilleja foliolosa]|uniref:DUF8039 domain-containing protein n=1 Tax=Castilleja foliolosa TaxID=1961234 RepID=A0ABD3CBW3_9LAMI
MFSREEFNNTIAEMDKKLQMILSSQPFSYKEPLTAVVESAKGSNYSAAPNLTDGDQAGEDHINDEYELYVEDPQRRLVAYGHIHDLGSTIHNLKLKVDEVRVTVVRVVVGDAEVPFPTDEFSKVAEAPQNFIVWPRRLVEHVGRKGLSQKELFPKPHMNKFPFRQCNFTIGIYIAYYDCRRETGSTDCLVLFIAIAKKHYRRGLDKGTSSASSHLSMGNWQFMVLCPKYSYVAWFCFLQNKPTKKIASKIETAFNTYQMMKGTHSRQLNKLKWVYPKCCKQGEGDECGLLVMRRMFEIIKLDISDSFEKVFNMLGPYSDDEIDVVRRQWAECFIEVLDES